MKISEVKTAFKVADVLLDLEHEKNHIKVIFLPEIINEKGEKLDNKFLRKKIGHVYLLVVDGKIKKIGGSGDSGGIKGSLRTYQSSMGGSPSSNRFGMQLIMKKVLESGSKIEIYVITSKQIISKVKGFFSEEDSPICFFKEMEDKCKKDYMEEEGEYPEWNFQERNEQFPQEIRKKYAKYKTLHAQKKK